jgi:hypothetical protein
VGICSPPQPDTPDKPPRKAPRISFVNAAAFVHTCKLEGSEQFSIHLHPEDSKLCSVSLKPDTPKKIDLSSIPSDYHDFPDVFSKRKADTLAPHREFDLKINLEEGASPPLGTVYPVSSTELESLQEFIDEHLSYGFICMSSSTHGAPVLFVRKKDRSLHLCAWISEALTKSRKRPLSTTPNIQPPRFPESGQGVYKDQPPSRLSPCPL